MENVAAPKGDARKASIRLMIARKAAGAPDPQVQTSGQPFGGGGGMPTEESAVPTFVGTALRFNVPMRWWSGRQTDSGVF